MQTAKIAEPIESRVYLSVKFEKVSVHLIIYGEMYIVTIFIRSFPLLHDIERIKNILSELICM